MTRFDDFYKTHAERERDAWDRGERNAGFSFMDDDDDEESPRPEPGGSNPETNKKVGIAALTAVVVSILALVFVR